MPEFNVTTEELVSVQEAARALNRPRVTIYRWLKSNRMNGIRLGGVLFVPQSEIERLKGEMERLRRGDGKRTNSAL